MEQLPSARKSYDNIAQRKSYYDPESKAKHDDVKPDFQARPKKKVTSAWIEIGESINSADITKCKMIKSKLESLLSTANQRVSMLEKKAKKQGLAYKGEDAIKCGCGNTFQSESEYAATCDKCADDKEKVEQCSECVKPCEVCGENLCDSCQVTCSGCDDTFCKECMSECGSCHELFCDRNKDCALVGPDYGGGSCCIYCHER